MTQHDRHGGGSLLDWRAISVQGKTDLPVLQNGTMTAVRYWDEILDSAVRPYTGSIGPGFILMDDKARTHRVHVVDQYLEDELSSELSAQLVPGKNTLKKMICGVVHA